MFELSTAVVKVDKVRPTDASLSQPACDRRSDSQIDGHTDGFILAVKMFTKCTTSLNARDAIGIVL